MGTYSSKFNFDDLLEDKATHFTGIVMAVSFYDTGCTHYGLCPTRVKEDGSIGNWEWLDEMRLTCKKKGKQEKEEPAGGPQPNALFF